MEGTPLSNAYKWLAENPSESASVASRIFCVLRSSIQSSISCLQRQSQKQKQKQKEL